MLSLTPVAEKDAIKRTVLAIKSKGENLLCWQPDSRGDGKVVISISADDFILGERFLVFSDQDLSAFHQGEDLFFYYKSKTIIFKSKVRTISKGHMICDPPTSLKLEESRKINRIYLDHGSKFLSISKKNRNSTPTRYRVGLVDISETGASFIINKLQFENLRKDDHVKIHALDKLIVTPTLGSIIRYVVPFKVSGANTYKVGVEFDRLLTASEIKEIKNH